MEKATELKLSQFFTRVCVIVGCRIITPDSSLCIIFNYIPIARLPTQIEKLLEKIIREKLKKREKNWRK